MVLISLIIPWEFDMYKANYFVFACLAFFASDRVFASELVTEVFVSKAQERDYRYTVYLPDVYQKDDLQKTYPVLYLLHGSEGDEQTWLRQGGARATLDALIARRLIQPLVVIMPGDSESWWVDGAAKQSETAMINELLPQVEAKYRVDASGDKRMIAGLSAGGYGALNLLLKYPQMFAAAAILSPALYDPLPPAHSSAMRHLQFQRAGKFDPALWASLNYPAFLESYKKSGIVVPLYINSGDHDTFGIALQSAILYEKLRSHQSNALELRIVNGDHEWLVWRDALGEALQFMNSHLVNNK